MDTANKSAARWISAITAAVTVFLAAAFLLLPKQEFSENENRYLQAFPAFTFRDLKDGTYTERLVSYFSDHFPFRDAFMTVKTETEILLGKREISGIFIAKDGSLVEEYRRPVNTDRVVRQMGKFSAAVLGRTREENRALRVTLMLVPTASEILREQLPENATLLSQEQTASEIEEGIRNIMEEAGLPEVRTVHLKERLLEKEKERLALEDGGERENRRLYYRTDHHWTTFGAYQGYLAFCGSAAIDALPEEAFRRTAVSEDFRGTIWSKLNDARFPGDRIEIWERKDTLPGITMYCEDTKKTSESLYNMEWLQKKDKYSMFLDNIHPLIEITNKNADTPRGLLLIKDSYANCMVPFLAEHFRKIYVLDTRYYKKGPSAFVGEHPEITDVLLLYNMNTLDADTGIGGIY